MAVKGYRVNVARAGVRNDGVVVIVLRSRDNKWTNDRVWLSSPKVAGTAANAFLASALACIASDMTAEAWLDEGLKQYDEIVQLVVARTGY